MSRKRSFAHSVKTQQLEWARSYGLGNFLEVRNKGQSWVLRRDATYKNLFKPDWWSYIEKKGHKWARALNSSQCFAVNLFAPLKDNTGCARKTLQKLMPERSIKDEDQVIADFEFTPVEAPTWLGEKEQPTQIDVYFEVKRQAESIGHVLIEVKYSER